MACYGATGLIADARITCGIRPGNRQKESMLPPQELNHTCNYPHLCHVTWRDGEVLPTLKGDDGQLQRWQLVVPAGPGGHRGGCGRVNKPASWGA